MLKPALRRLWRDPTTLQLGIDPRHAVVLAGVHIEDMSLIDLLDGSRDLDELSAEAGRRGHLPDRVEHLLATLRDADALDDAPIATERVSARLEPDLMALSLVHRSPGAANDVLMRRQRASVEVLGAGRVGATIATLLAAAGVGHLEVADPGPLRASDYAPGGVRSPGTRQGSRADALRVLLGSAGAPPAAGGGGSDSAVVLAPTSSVVPPEWLGRVRHRPHLPVVIRETTAVIGPFVVPGETPCLRCVELTRGDRDPTWPVLAAQLIGATPSVEPSDIALASAAASIATLHVLAWLDASGGPPSTFGGTLELSLTDLRLRRRTIAAHPGCGCGAA
jgi:bacteriocin biosynthesis cyclodehydratase domain-containing protein